MLLVLFSVLTLIAAGGMVALTYWCGARSSTGPDLSREEMRRHVWWRLLYVNPADPRGWVPKPTGLGVTVNFRTKRLAGAFLILLVCCLFGLVGLLLSVWPT